VKDQAGSSDFLGRAGPLVLARFATALLGISIPLVLARMLPLEDYGTYKQLFLLSQTLYFVLPLGVPQGLFYFLPRVEERRSYLFQSLLFMAGMGCLSAVLLHGALPWLSGVLNNPALLEHRLALSVYTGALLGSFGLEPSLTARGRTGAAAIAYLISDTTRALLLVLPVLFGFGLAGMMGSLAAYALLRWGLAWWVGLSGERGPFWVPTHATAQLRYALPFGAAMALAIPQQYAHQYAVSWAVSPEAFAIYAVGCFQLPLVDLLYTPTSEVLMVRLGELDAQGRSDEGVGAFREASGKLAYVFLPMAAFLFAAAPDFIGGLFGARYLDAVPIFRVSVLAVCLALLPMDGVLRARGRTRAIFFSYLTKAVVTVPLVYVGVTRFGMMGAVSAWALAELVGKCTLLAAVPGALGLKGVRGVLRMLPLQELARAGGAAMAAAVSVWLLRSGVPGRLTDLHDGWVRLLPLAVAGVLFLMGYALLLRLSGVNPMEVVAAFRPRRAQRAS